MIPPPGFRRKGHHSDAAESITYIKMQIPSVSEGICIFIYDLSFSSASYLIIYAFALTASSAIPQVLFPDRAASDSRKHNPYAPA